MRVCVCLPREGPLILGPDCPLRARRARNGVHMEEKWHKGLKMAKTKNGEIEILQGRGGKLRGYAVLLMGAEICVICAFLFLSFAIPRLSVQAQTGGYTTVGVLFVLTCNVKRGCFRIVSVHFCFRL